MRSLKLKDRTMNVDEYQKFKSLLETLGAKFSATEGRFGTQGVDLKLCEVTFDFNPQTEIMARQERANVDEKKSWSKIVEFCNERGFTPA